jgi:uncharacterized protein YndB with AHSA1/START domain
MSKASFVYVIYIRSTPEKVWNALTKPELTRKYWWNHRNHSDWKPGSPWQHQDADDPEKVDIVGKVVEIEAPRRLVLTWASPSDARKADKVSRVTLTSQAWEGSVRFTVLHEELEPKSDMLHGITAGWPAVCSSLKSFLETGKSLPGSSARRETPPE